MVGMIDGQTRKVPGDVVRQMNGSAGLPADQRS